MSDTQFATVSTKKQRVDIETRLYQWLGQHDGYYTHPPMDRRKFYLPNNEIISLNNDGMEVWFGTMDKWHCFYRKELFVKISFWYIGLWIFKDWCGLRTKLWYSLLSRQVKRNRSIK
jgi:hypothetical protein